MKQSKKSFLVVGTLLILSSTQALFSDEKLFSPIAFFVGVNTLLITIALAHIERKNSAKLFSAYLGMFLLAYVIIDYISIGDVKLLFFTFEGSVAVTLRSIIYLYLIGFVVFAALWQGNFLQLKGKIAFKMAVILLACFLLIEFPIYDIHKLALPVLSGASARACASEGSPDVKHAFRESVKIIPDFPEIGKPTDQANTRIKIG